MVGRSNGYRIYERSCPYCVTTWYPGSGGAGKRACCEECYPKHRQSVNLCANAKLRAEKLKVDFDLDISFVFEKLKQVCPRTGLPFVIGVGSNYSNRHPQVPSVDKINPTLGYTKDNVQIVCWWYNCAKQRYSDQEVLKLCKAVVNSSSI